MNDYELAVEKGERQKKKMDIIIDQLRIMRGSAEADFEDNAVGSALIILGSIYAIDNPIGVVSSDTKEEAENG